MSIFVAFLIQFTIQDGEMAIYHTILPTYTSTRQQQICNDRVTEVFYDSSRSKPLHEITIEGKAVENNYIGQINNSLKEASISSVSLTKCDIVNGVYTTTFEFRIFEGGENPRKRISVDFFSRTIQHIHEE